MPDGKPLDGKRRLTDVAIDNIQKFYGLAIRRNVGDVSQMKKAIWAEFFHFGSSDNNQLHFLCDKSWCKYMKAEEEGTIADVFDRMFILMVQMFQEMHTYHHKDHFHLPMSVMDKIEPISGIGTAKPPSEVCSRKNVKSEQKL